MACFDMPCVLRPPLVVHETTQNPCRTVSAGHLLAKHPEKQQPREAQGSPPLPCKGPLAPPSQACPTSPHSLSAGSVPRSKQSRRPRHNPRHTSSSLQTFMHCISITVHDQPFRSGRNCSTHNETGATRLLTQSGHVQVAIRLYQTLWQVEHRLHTLSKQQDCGHTVRKVDRLWSIDYEQKRALCLGPRSLRSRSASGLCAAAWDCVECCATVLQAIQQGQRQALFTSLMAGGGPSGEYGAHQSNTKDDSLAPCEKHSASVSDVKGCLQVQCAALSLVQLLVGC
jgi:hypothetical protein